MAKSRGADGLAGGEKQLLRRLFNRLHRLHWQDCTVTRCAGNMGHSRTHPMPEPDPCLHLLFARVEQHRADQQFFQVHPGSSRDAKDIPGTGVFQGPVDMSTDCSII